MCTTRYSLLGTVRVARLSHSFDRSPKGKLSEFLKMLKNRCAILFRLVIAYKFRRVEFFVGITLFTIKNIIVDSGFCYFLIFQLSWNVEVLDVICNKNEHLSIHRCLVRFIPSHRSTSRNRLQTGTSFFYHGAMDQKCTGHMKSQGRRLRLTDFKKITL